MIPGNESSIEKLKELAARNIANGDWGDEVSVPGLEGAVPISAEEREAKGVISRTISKAGSQRVPTRKK